MSAIALSGVTKVYDGDTPAVDGVDLEVGEGEFVVLLGPTGCGKTTILRIVAGLEPATSGTVQLGDRPVDHLPVRQRRVAMVFQEFALYPHLTVAENIAFPLRTEPSSGEIVRLTKALGVGTLYVTHDQTEAMTMADRIAVMRRGRIEQVGTPNEIYSDPQRLFVAAFVGTPRT